jgi:hypothetical protein
VNSAVASTPSLKNENYTGVVQGVVRFHLPNEDHLPAVNHARKERSVAVNNLVAIGDTKKRRSLAINHARMEMKDNSEFNRKAHLWETLD